MPTLWFSYSMLAHQTFDTPEPGNSPYTISYHVGRMLRQRAAEHGYTFRYVNLDDPAHYTIGPDDIVIGHPWYTRNGFIEHAFAQPCKAKIVVQPYADFMVGEDAIDLLHALWQAADALLLITGPYWWGTMPATPYADYQAKATRLDMAVNADKHPMLKRWWGKPGKRAVLLLGHDMHFKGLDASAELARVAGFKVGHYGSATHEMFRHVPQATLHGGKAFDTPTIQQIVDTYDLFITMGRHDPNPTTLLETACWGLVGACTPQSGYWPEQPFAELRHGDMAFNLEQIDWLQHASDYDLRQRAATVRQYVEDCHSWQRFTDTVWGVVRRFV